MSPEYTVQGLLDIGKTVIKIKRGIVTLGKITSYSPVCTDSAPVLTDSTPVLTDSAPVLTDSTPVLTDSTPVLTESTPVLTDLIASDIDVDEASTINDKSHFDGFAVLSSECALHSIIENIPTTSSVLRIEENSSSSTAMETQESSSSLSFSKTEMQTEAEQKTEVEAEVEIEIENQEAISSILPNISSPSHFSASSTLQGHSAEQSAAATLLNTSMSANSGKVISVTCQKNGNIDEVQTSTIRKDDQLNSNVEVAVVSQVEVAVDLTELPSVFIRSHEVDENYLSYNNDNDNKNGNSNSNNNSESRNCTSTNSIMENETVSNSQNIIMEEDTTVVRAQTNFENKKKDISQISGVWGALYEDSSIATFTESELRYQIIAPNIWGNYLQVFYYIQ